jgi:hypothetical protein
VSLEDALEVAMLELRDHQLAGLGDRKAERQDAFDAVGHDPPLSLRYGARRRQRLFGIPVGQVTELEAACDGVAKLAYVARPGVGVPPREELRREDRGVAAELRRDPGDQVRDVASPPPQRRELDARDGETVEEIVAEATRLYLGVEIAPRGGDDANVDAERPVAADAAELLPVEHAEQLRLEGEVEIADLVDEERPAVRLLEHASSSAATKFVAASPPNNGFWRVSAPC